MERIGLTRTRRQIADVTKRVTRKKNPVPFREAWVDHFVSDKFGAATTHWSKLQDRVQRGRRQSLILARGLRGPLA